MHKIWLTQKGSVSLIVNITTSTPGQSVGGLSGCEVWEFGSDGTETEN